MVWGKQAEIAGQYLTKGKQIYVEGKLQTRKWKDKDGNEKYTTEVKGDRVVLLSGAGGARGEGGGAGGERSSGRSTTSGGGSMDDGMNAVIATVDQAVAASPERPLGELLDRLRRANPDDDTCILAARPATGLTQDLRRYLRSTGGGPAP